MYYYNENMKKRNIQLPTILPTESKVFKSVKQYKNVRNNLFKILCGSGSKNQKNRSSYIFSNLEVKFLDSVTNEQVQPDYLNGKIVVLSPAIKGESESEREMRRRFILIEYSPIFEAIAIKATTHIYLVVEENERKKLAKSK